MRTTMEVLLGFFIINLSFGLVMGLALPGTAAVGSVPNGDASQYAGQYLNSTNQIANGGWSGTPFSGIPVIGDIFAGFNFLWQNIQYLVNGFPMFLQWLGHTYIADVAAYNSFMLIAYVLEAIYGFLALMFLIEFISGREFLP